MLVLVYVALAICLEADNWSVKIKLLQPPIYFTNSFCFLGLQSTFFGVSVPKTFCEIRQFFSIMVYSIQSTVH
jgi:hypothetical protein